MLPAFAASLSAGAFIQGNSCSKAACTVESRMKLHGGLSVNVREERERQRDPTVQGLHGAVVVAQGQIGRSGKHRLLWALEFKGKT